MKKTTVWLTNAKGEEKKREKSVSYRQLGAFMTASPFNLQIVRVVTLSCASCVHTNGKHLNEKRVQRYNTAPQFVMTSVLSLIQETNRSVCERIRTFRRHIWVYCGIYVQRYVFRCFSRALMWFHRTVLSCVVNRHQNVTVKVSFICMLPAWQRCYCCRLFII